MWRHLTNNNAHRHRLCNNINYATTSTTNAICMWYHFYARWMTSIPGHEPSTVGWLKHPRAWALNRWTIKHSRAWALNGWMINIPGHEPPTMHEYERLSGVYQHTTQQHLMVYISIQPTTTYLERLQLCLTTMTTPQLDNTTQQHQRQLNLARYNYLHVSIHNSILFIFIYEFYHLNNVK